MPQLTRGLAPDVEPAAIDPSATIVGQTLVEGADTRIGAGAHIENSYLKNVCVMPGARIVNSVVLATGEGGGGHAPEGYASRWAIGQSYPPVVGEGAEITDSTIRDAGIGARTRCIDAYVGSGTVGPDNVLRRVYAESIRSGEAVSVEGPTELSEVWLGHHTTIDTCGFFEGVFANDFYVVEYDERAGELRVRETLDVPHVSRYGMNTINSTNSGNLKDQPDGALRSLGPHQGLWQDSLLSHEPMVLGPCCWVSGWTKVIGKSAAAHDTAAAMLGDALATHLMPFSVSGLEGGSVTGRVLPGERFDSPMPRSRLPGWVFTYAPAAIIAMVRRVAEATGDSALADRLPQLALQSALALVRAQAAERGVDLGAVYARPPKGWKGWLLEARRVLGAHLESGLWEFSGGEPVAWRGEGDGWVPVEPRVLTDIAADAIEEQVCEETLTVCEMEPLPRTLGVTTEELSPTRGDTTIDDQATVANTAVIGPGVQIRGASTVADGAWLCHAVVDNAVVGAGARLVRSIASGSSIGSGASVLSARVTDSSIAAQSSVTCARIASSTLAGVARVSPYALIEDSHLAFPCIVGSSIRHSRVDSTFMSYHMPGEVEGLIVEPSHVRRGGEEMEVAAIPMLGGGLRVLGDRQHPVRMECAFIGSNAILEGDAYVGFGSFVLGRLTSAEGLPPFTVSTSAGPERDQIGMVVHQFANMVITHFVNWAYQALGPDRAEEVGLLVPTMLAEGRAAVAWAQEQRRTGAGWEAGAPYAKYGSLALYSDAQLAAGARAYQQALDDGRWKMGFQDRELRFVGQGSWKVQGGVARWEAGRAVG